MKRLVHRMTSPLMHLSVEEILLFESLFKFLENILFGSNHIQSPNKRVSHKKFNFVLRKGAKVTFSWENRMFNGTLLTSIIVLPSILMSVLGHVTNFYFFQLSHFLIPWLSSTRGDPLSV